MLNNKVYGEFPRGQVLPGLVVPRLFLSLVNVFTSPGKCVSGTVGLKANTVLGLTKSKRNCLDVKPRHH